ncbi:protein of unknown function [Denitratisoma oestradiolicum]|uniref:Uncharacterized protein n=1 Tax=Denitratisoma oestradiolicum TaxID=311182 RepID=A0A6S6XR21_9PROT|nr:protein of unknown function [Denitratisoma oestradiolicum]
MARRRALVHCREIHFQTWFVAGFSLSWARGLQCNVGPPIPLLYRFGNGNAFRCCVAKKCPAVSG